MDTGKVTRRPITMCYATLYFLCSDSRWIAAVYQSETSKTCHTAGYMYMPYLRSRALVAETHVSETHGEPRNLLDSSSRCQTLKHKAALLTAADRAVAEEVSPEGDGGRNGPLRKDRKIWRTGNNGVGDVTETIVCDPSPQRELFNLCA